MEEHLLTWRRSSKVSMRSDVGFPIGEQLVCIHPSRAIAEEPSSAPHVSGDRYSNGINPVLYDGYAEKRSIGY